MSWLERERKDWRLGLGENRWKKVKSMTSMIHKIAQICRKVLQWCGHHGPTSANGRASLAEGEIANRIAARNLQTVQAGGQRTISLSPRVSFAPILFCFKR